MNIIDAKSWADEMDMVVTVCDLEGKIVYMNKASIKNFEKRGGAALIGKSLYHCHNEQSVMMIKKQLKEKSTHIFQTDTKLIRQFPWIENGEHKGIIEVTFPFNSNPTNL